MSKFKLGRVLSLLLISAPLALLSCGGDSSSDGGNNNADDGNGGGEPATESSARISGSVTLSSSVAGSNKPGAVLQRSAAKALQFKVTPDSGVQVLNKPNLSSGFEAVSLMSVGDAVSNAYVYLYDAEHPEWLGPVAQDVTNNDGEYVFEAYGCTDNVSSADCSSDAATNDDAYVDGDPLPFGIYTMLVYKPSTFDPITGVTTDPIVSVLPAFKAETEELTVDDAEAEVSDATPNVITMFGIKKNTDGTETWGSSATQLPGNTAIQITFDMAMSRGSVQNIMVENGSEVAGSWSLSPDWKTATFTPSAALAADTYTVTVPATTVNVYSNTMGYAASGTFTAVSEDSTAPTVSVSSPTAATDVPATTPIRISSNEVLKTNALRVESTPSLGDFPSMTLVDSDGSSFVYEVITTKALQLGETYNVTISGIQDGSGNTSADLTTSFSVQGAASAEGVDDAATDATQAAQVAISEIFAKWVRAVNERNSATIQSLMSGAFVFEYSVQAEDGFDDYDLNRNGRLSLKEFMKMINDGMLNWEYCETTVSGNIDGPINVTSAASGDFEFTLSFASTNTSQQCSDEGGSMFATVKNINGLWKLARMSEGYDHRGTTLTSYELIEALLYETADNAAGEQLVPNWGQLQHFADNETPLTFKFDHVSGAESYVFLLVNERDPSELGFAFAMSADRLACGTETSCSATEGDDLELTVPDPFGDEGMPSGAYPVSEIFGFDDERDWGIENPGEIFMWEIIGMSSYTARAMADSTPSAVEFVRDINSVSAVKRFQNPGKVVDMQIDVEAFSFGPDEELGGGDDVSQGVLEYSIYNGGYDALAADYVKVSVAIPDENGDLDNIDARFQANSNIGWAEYPVTFYYDSAISASVASADMLLYKGWTWMEVGNGMNRWENFQILTSGGKGPDARIAAITAFDSNDSSLANLNLDQWAFADASSEALGTSEGAASLDVSWDISDGINNSDGLGGKFDMQDFIDLLTTQNCAPTGPGWINLNVNVWNDSGAYTQFSYCPEGGGGTSTPAPTGDIDISGNTISVQGLKIYEGDNWIGLNFHGDDGAGNFYETQSSFGVYTDGGSEFVAPVELISITTSEGTPDEIGNWGQGSDWDATDVTDSTSELTMVFKFADASSPMIHAGSDGVCCSDEPMDYDANSDSYSITLNLYRGYNWISVEDGSGSWYNVNIFTENGAEVPKPNFLTANGIAIPEEDDMQGPRQVTVDQCLITLTGTVPANTERLNLNWNGGTSSEGYWEGQEIFFPADTDQLQEWTATFQLVGGAGAHNHIDAWDEVNRTGSGLEVFTSDNSCEYTQAELTVDGVRLNDASGVELVNDGMDNYGTAASAGDGVEPITATSVWVYGTSSLPGRSIYLNSRLCSQEVKFSTSASTEANGAGSFDWGVEVLVYDDNPDSVNFDTGPYPFNQWLDVSDGQSWQNLALVSDSNVIPAPSMSVDLPGNMTEVQDQFGGGCSMVSWEANPLTETSAVISGHTNNEDAWGGYGHANFASSFLDFEIDENGDFSFEINLFNSHNHIWISDDRGGYTEVEIYTENGNYPPQYLTINGFAVDGGSAGELTTLSTGISGDVTISGDLNVIDSEQFTPEWLNANVTICGMVQCQDFNFDSMLQVPNEFAMPMAYDPMNPQDGFSLLINIPTAVNVHVNVWGCAREGGCHGHDFSFNDEGMDDENVYKPGQSLQGDKYIRHTR
jgi:hypothetical protein